MSYPWRSEVKAKAQQVAPVASRKRLQFEPLESRILLSGEIGIPPNDPFIDVLAKDKFAAIETRWANSNQFPHVDGGSNAPFLAPQVQPENLPVSERLPVAPMSSIVPLIDPGRHVVDGYFPDRLEKLDDIQPQFKLPIKVTVGNFEVEDGPQVWHRDDIAPLLPEFDLQVDQLYSAGTAFSLWSLDIDRIEPSQYMQLQDPNLNVPGVATDMPEQTETSFAAGDNLISRYGRGDFVSDRTGKFGGDDETTTGSSDVIEDQSSYFAEPREPGFVSPGSVVTVSEQNDAHTAVNEDLTSRYGSADFFNEQVGQFDKHVGAAAELSDIGVVEPSQFGEQRDSGFDLQGFAIDSPEQIGTSTDAEENFVSRYGRADFFNDRFGKAIYDADAVVSLALIRPPTDDSDTSGTGGDDTFENSANSNNFFGTAGDDRYLFGDNWGDDGVVEVAAEGVDTLDFSAVTSNLTFTISIDGTIDVSDGVNTLSASANIENLVGGQGDDLFVFEDGATLAGTIDGRGGNDTLDYSRYIAATSVAVGASLENLIGGAGDDVFMFNDVNLVTATIDTGGGSDTLDFSPLTTDLTFTINLDGTVTITDGAITLTSNGIVDNLVGGQGNDAFIFQDGAIIGTLDGSGGSDTLDYSSVTTSIAVDLSVDTASATTSISNIENVLGGSQDDTITGDNEDNIFAGGAGNDVLIGGGGIDTISFATAQSAVTFDLGIVGPQDIFGNATETETASDFENVIGTGFGIGAGRGDTLTGTADANQFFVAAGALMTTINGGDGEDTLVVDGNTEVLTSSDGTTLTFSNSATPTIMHGAVENVLVENSPVALETGQVQALVDGLQALADRFNELESIDGFASSIPLADPLGVSFGELQNFGRVLQELVDEFQEFVDGLDTAFPGGASSAHVTDFLAGWMVDLANHVDVVGSAEDISGTIAWLANTLAANDQIVVNGSTQDLRFVQQLSSTRDSSMDLFLSETLRDAGVEVERETLFDLLSGFQLDFSFGLSGIETAPGSFFVDEALQLSSSASLAQSSPVNVFTDALIGFMGGSIDGELSELHASADVELIASDGRWTVDELAASNPFSVASEDGSITSNLFFTTDTGFESAIADLGNGTIDLASMNFLTEDLTVVLPGQSADFTLITPNELLNMLDQLGAWLGGLAQSEILNLSVPFAGNTTIGDLIDFGEAFGESLLRSLVHHDGLRLSADLLASGVLPGSDLVEFSIEVEMAGSEPQIVVVTLNPTVTSDNGIGPNSPAENLRLDIENAVIAALIPVIGAADAAEVEVFLEEGRIGFRPQLDATAVLGVSLPSVGNESLGFDGNRLVVPTAVVESGVLGHELQFTLNADGEEHVFTVSRITDPNSSTGSGDDVRDIDDLIAEINDQLATVFDGITVANDDSATRQLVFDVAPGATLVTDPSVPIGGVALVNVRQSSSLVDGLLSLGVEAASFVSAQDLANQLNEILAEFVTGVTVNFDVANSEMSFTVALEREFDIASLPIDLSVDLGEFIDIESMSDLAVTADAQLAFTFGVDLTPAVSLVVAPPVVVPQLPDLGQLSDTASFDVTLLQENFEENERLSGSTLQVSDWTIVANTGATAMVAWAAPVSGRVVDSNDDPERDQLFFIEITDDEGERTFVDAVLLSFNTLENADDGTGFDDLAGDLESAISSALDEPRFAGLQVTISNASADSFEIEASGTGFDGYQLRLVTEDEFAVADFADVSVARDTQNQSLDDLLQDIQNAVDQATDDAELERTDDTSLGLTGPVVLSASGAAVIGDIPVPENGVLVRDVYFEVVIGTETFRGVLSADATIDNEQENDDEPDPIAALAQDVQDAINAAIGDPDAEVFVNAQSSQRLDYAVAVANANGDDIRLHFVTPAVIAEFNDQRFSLYATAFLAQPDNAGPGRLLARSIVVDNLNDPALMELGLLSSPIPGNGRLGSDAVFQVAIDDVVYDITVSEIDTVSNNSVDDLIADINDALVAAIGDNDVFARRVMLTEDMSTEGNRIEFATATLSGIQSLALPAVSALLTPGNAPNAAVDQLGFSTEDEYSARIQSAEFFIEDATLSGGLNLDATNIEATAVVGLGGEGGVGLGVEVIDSTGGIFGDVAISLINPDAAPGDADETRLSLGTLWEHLGGDIDSPISEIVAADITGGVDIDLNVAPVLPIRTPIEPALIDIGLELSDWLSSPPSLDDASLENGLSVNITGLDLNIYDALSNLTFSDVVDALQQIVEFLRELQGDGDGEGGLATILDQPLPLLNQSPSELLLVADQFAALVDEVIANPAGSLGQLESMLEDLLGVPDELVTLALDFDDGLALRVDLQFNAGIQESFGLDLNIEDLVGLTDPDSAARDLLDGVTSLVGVSSTGDLSVGVDGTVRLSFGIALGSGNGSAEALGFKDGAMSDGGLLTANGDAQVAADRLVDQDVEFDLVVDGEVFRVTVTAGDQTSGPVEVGLTTLLSDLTDALMLDVGADIQVTLADGTTVDIDLGPDAATTTIDDAIDAINANAGLQASFNEELQRVEIEDTSTATAGTTQSGVFVTQTGVTQGQALQFYLELGVQENPPVLVSVDEMLSATRAQWLAAIDEAIRQAMVDAGQLNPVADAVVDATFVAGRLTLQGTGEGIGTRLTLTLGGVFSVSDLGTSNAASRLGLAGSDDNGDQIIAGRELRTDASADTGGLVNDLQQAVDAALAGTVSPPVTVSLRTSSSDDISRLEFSTDPGVELEIRSVTQVIRPFLYNGSDGTALLLNAGANGENLEFTAQVGPFGFFVIDGTANLDASFQLSLEDTGEMDGRTYLGANGDEIALATPQVEGSAIAELPLFFPTESIPVGDQDNTLVISIPELLGFLGEDNGSGGVDRTEGSVGIQAPDLTAFPTPTLIGMLSNPEFIIDGLDSILLSIQDALDGEVYGIDMPLIGDGLAPAGQFVADFREDVLAYLSLKLREGGLNPVTLVQETLYNIFAGADDGDPAAVRVLGFEPDVSADGTLVAAGVLTTGMLDRNAELNITVGNEDTTRIVVFADDIADDTPEALVEAINNSLDGRGLAEQVTAGFVDVDGGFQITFTATEAADLIVIETAGAIALDLFGLSVGALDFLKNAVGPEGIVDINDIMKTGFGLFDEFGQFDFLLGQETVFGESLDFDLGLPILDFDLDAGVELELGWELGFGFGVSQTDGFYFVSDSALAPESMLTPGRTAELIISLDVSLLGILGFSPGTGMGVEPADGPVELLATTELPSDGQLTGDVVFALEVGGQPFDNILIAASDTSENMSALDLVADIQRSIDAALGVANLVTAEMALDANGDSTGKLRLRAADGSSLVIFDTANVSGRFGYLAIDAIDLEEAGEYTGLGIEIIVDIMDPGTGSSQDGRLSFSEISASSTQLSDIIVAEATGNAMVNLGLTVNFDGLGLDSSFLPAISTDLLIDWTVSFSSADGGEILAPDVDFRDITLDLGSFISDFAGPFLSDIGALLEPLDFLLDRQSGLLYQRLPVISDLAGETVTLKQLAELLDTQNRITPFLNAVEQIYFLIDLVSDAAAEADASGGSLLLEFGTISLDNLNALQSNGQSLADASPDIGSLNQGASDTFNDDPNSSTPATQNFTRNVTRPGNGTVSFDILQPGNIVDLLLGKPDVNLITYDLPPFGFDFEYLQRFPIFPPLFATLRGFFSATVDLGFGYDTLGLNQFLASDNPLDLVNGFFITDVDADGVDIPEVTLQGGIAAGASLDAGVASAGVEGGINASILFNLNDPNQDTKVRLGEMLGNILLNDFNPLAIFDTSGRIDAFLRAYVEVLFGLWSDEYEIGRVTLASFDIPFERPPILAQDLGSGVLQLNMGTASENRIHGSLADGNESVYVRFDSGSVFVSATENGPEQRFIGVDKITVNAGAGDDMINLEGLAGSGIEVEVRGGTGDDTIIGAAGIRNVIFGDEGNDIIRVGGVSATAVANEIDGGDGNDQITGGRGADLIFGGAGNDTIAGGDGDDDIEGGTGDDTIVGGDGDDTYRFSSNWGNDEVDEETDLLGLAAPSGGVDTWDFSDATTDINFQLGSDVGVGAIENIVATPNGLRVTSTRHGLQNGDQITLTGAEVEDSSNPGTLVDVNQNFTVSVDPADPDAFTVIVSGLPDELTYVEGGIFQLDRSALIVDEFRAADPDGSEMPIQIETSLRHRLQSGDTVFVGGVDPVSGETVLEGVEYTVTVVDSRTFNLDGTTFSDPPFLFDDAFVQRNESGTGIIEGVTIRDDGVGVFVEIQSIGHGLSFGDEIAVFGSNIDDAVVDANALNNKFTVTAVTDSSFEISVADEFAGLLPASIDAATAVWQLNNTHAASVGNSVSHNGYGVETIIGSRGGDNFNIFQTGSQTIVLDGGAGSDTYTAHAVESRVGQGATANTRLFDTGDFWDTDVALFFGSQSADMLEIDNTNIVTVLDADSSDNPRFSYGEPNVVLGFQSGDSAEGTLTADTSLASGVLDRDARLLLSIGDTEAVLLIVQPEDVDDPQSVGDLVDALNDAINDSELAGQVEAINDNSTVTLNALAMGGNATITVENVSQGSGIEAVEVTALAGADTIQIGSTNSRTSVSISGGLGDDAIDVGGFENSETNFITLNGIRGSALTGSLIIDGDEGNNLLSLTDADDGENNDGMLTDSVLSGLGMQINIEYSDFADLTLQLGSGSDRFTIESTIDGSSQIFAGIGDDDVDIQSLSGMVTVDGEAGDDSILLETSNFGSTAAIVGNSGDDTIDIRSMQGDVRASGDDGADLINVGSTAGIGASGSVNLINGLLDISGGTGIDTLNIDDSGDGGMTTSALSQLSGSAQANGRLSGDAHIDIDFGDGEFVSVTVVAEVGVLRADAPLAAAANGRLSGDAFFILDVGEQRYEVTVPIDASNQSADDLVDDINTAFDRLGLEPERVIARVDGDTLVIESLQGDDVSLQVDADDPAALELGFSNNSVAVFDNNSLADLEADINAALASAGVGDRISAAIDTDESRLMLTLLSGDFVRFVLDADDPADTELGLLSNQLIQPNNVGTLRINDVTGRAELTGLGMGAPGDGVPGIVYDSANNVNIGLGSGNDEFNVQGTLNDDGPSLTTIATNDGDDTLNVSNTAPVTEPIRGALSGILDAVQGELSIFAGEGFNTLNISDRGSAVADTDVSISDNRIGGLAPAAINYAASGGFAGGINIWAGSGSDVVSFVSTLSDNVTTFHANSGDDQITMLDLDNSADDGLLVIEGGLGSDIVDGAAWNAPLFLFGDEGEVTYQDRERSLAQVVRVETLQADAGGTDRLLGGSTNDLLLGGSDGDIISGGAGDDIVIGDGGQLTFNDGDVISVEATDFFIGGADRLAGGQMNDASRLGGDGNDVIIGGAGFDTLFGSLSEDILIYEYGRVLYDGDLASSVVVLGQQPLDLAASEMFGLYLKDRFLVSPYHVGDVFADRAPISASTISVSTGGRAHGNQFHEAVCQNYLAQVTFELNSAMLTPASHDYLIGAATVLAGFDGLIVQISGHADNAGDENHNLQLSLDRAIAVTDALQKYGVNPDILRSVGYGEELPIANNDTAEGRAENRRVEIKLDSGAACHIDDLAPETGSMGMGLLGLSGWLASQQNQSPVQRKRIHW